MLLQARVPCAVTRKHTLSSRRCCCHRCRIVCREQAFVAFDYPPDVQVKLEQWGLDTLTLGAVPAAVDEWARIALQQALAPLVLPG